MKRLRYASLAAVAFALGGPAIAQTLPAGPPVNIQAVTQVGPALPQYTKVDIPLLREGVPQKSGGRITVTLASWPERNLNGPEIIRLVRSGQVDIGAVPLNTVSGEVPMLDMVDLAGLNPSVSQARKVSQALLPELNKELERFNTRIVAMYPFAAQVFFCRDKVASLADLKGKRIRTGGGSSNTFVTVDRRAADRDRLPRSLCRAGARRGRLRHHRLQLAATARAGTKSASRSMHCRCSGRSRCMS